MENNLRENIQPHMQQNEQVNIQQNIQLKEQPHIQTGMPPGRSSSLYPYQGIILLIVSAVIIFLIGPFLSAFLGLHGTLLSEYMLLGAALLIVWMFKSNFEEAFPIKMPTITGISGIILLWLGTFGIVMVLTLVITALFPAQMYETGSGLNSAFTGLPFLITVFILAITPSICEEAVFRGVVLHSFRSYMSKWGVIALTGVIFGIFHGSIWRFVPTALLGMMLAYIVAETDNMIYSGIVHCINNLLPVVLLFLTQGIYENVDVPSAVSGAANWMAVGVYMIMGMFTPFCIYIGNYLLHREQPGYRTSIFPRGRYWIAAVLAAFSFTIMISGVMIIVISIAAEPAFTNEILQSL